MKKIATNMTFGQVLFILFILTVSSLMFFYLGAKFGGDIMSLSEQQQSPASEPFLPDESLTLEIENLISDYHEKLEFFEVVEDRMPAQGIKVAASIEPTVRKNITPVPQSMTAPTPPAAKVEPATSKKPVPGETAKKILMPGDGIQPKQEIIPNSSQIRTTAVKTAPMAEKLNVILPVGDHLQQDVNAKESKKSYRLQMGSYAQKKRALEAKAEWEKRGFAVALVQTNIPGKGMWYRLNVGSYSSLAEVQSVQRQIMRNYQQTAMILSSSNN